MGLSGCGKFLKYSLFLFNAVVLAAGFCMLGFGLYAKLSDSNPLKELSTFLSEDTYQMGVLSVIVAGGVVVVLAFFGCCGAIKEVKCMLVTFFLMLCLMLTGLIVGGILVYAFRANINNVVLETMKTSLRDNYSNDPDIKSTKTWNYIQEKFECCGVDGGINSTQSWNYYRNTSWIAEPIIVDDITSGIKYQPFVPKSCCRNAKNATLLRQCQGGPGFDTLIPARSPGEGLDNDQLYTDGCYTAVMAFIIANIKIVAGLVAGVAVLMVTGMVFAICLCRRIEDEFLFD